MLRDHCTTDLRNALDRVARRRPDRRGRRRSRRSSHRTSNDEIGDVAEAVGAIRDSTVQSVHAYNAMRAQLAATMAELSEQRQTVAAASQQMAATSDETGRAVARSPPP